MVIVLNLFLFLETLSDLFAFYSTLLCVILPQSNLWCPVNAAFLKNSFKTLPATLKIARGFGNVKGPGTIFRRTRGSRWEGTDMHPKRHHLLYVLGRGKADTYLNTVGSWKPAHR